MIKTKTALKRDKRNEQIIARYNELMTPGAMKSAVAEVIAKELRTSITTVNRIVKKVK